jgi:hypothetical protein
MEKLKTIKHNYGEKLHEEKKSREKNKVKTIWNEQIYFVKMGNNNKF